MSVTIDGGPQMKYESSPRMGASGKTRCSSIKSMRPVKPRHSGCGRVTSCVTSRFNTWARRSISASNNSSCGDSAACTRRIGLRSLRSAQVRKMDIIGVMPTPAAINTKPIALSGGVNPPCGPSIHTGRPGWDATRRSVNTPPRRTVTCTWRASCADDENEYG